MLGWLCRQVPGIAKRGAEILAEGEGDDCVTNTYQLIGKFLALRGPDKDDHEVRIINQSVDADGCDSSAARKKPTIKRRTSLEAVLSALCAISASAHARPSLGAPIPHAAHDPSRVRGAPRLGDSCIVYCCKIFFSRTYLNLNL